MATANPPQLHQAGRDEEIAPSRLSVRRADVVGALLISSQIKSQLFTTNKDSQ